LRIQIWKVEAEWVAYKTRTLEARSRFRWTWAQQIAKINESTLTYILSSKQKLYPVLTASWSRVVSYCLWSEPYSGVCYPPLVTSHIPHCRPLCNGFPDQQTLHSFPRYAKVLRKKGSYCRANESASSCIRPNTWFSKRLQTPCGPPKSLKYTLDSLDN
jgi:hypothetical protein